MSYDPKSYDGRHRSTGDWIGLIFGTLILAFVGASYIIAIIMLAAGWLS